MCRKLMTGKAKHLLEDIAHKVEANTASPFCVGDSLTIADITVSYHVGVRLLDTMLSAGSHVIIGLFTLSRTSSFFVLRASVRRCQISVIYTFLFPSDGRHFQEPKSPKRCFRKLSKFWSHPSRATLVAESASPRRIPHLSPSPFFSLHAVRISRLHFVRGQMRAVFATVQAGFLTGIPKTMIEDICPSLKALDEAVLKHPKVCNTVHSWSL